MIPFLEALAAALVLALVTLGLGLSAYAIHQARLRALRRLTRISLGRRR